MVSVMSAGHSREVATVVDLPLSSPHTNSEAALNSGSLWNMFLTARLIDLWWERPSLYDSTAEEYKDKTKRNRDVAEIAAQLSVNDQDVRKKMNNLRRQYAREKALLEKSRMNIASTGDGVLYESNWLYYSRMTFLDTFINTKPTGSKAVANERQVKSEAGPIDSCASNTSDDGIPPCKIARREPTANIGCRLAEARHCSIPAAASSTILTDCSIHSSSPSVDCDDHSAHALSRSGSKREASSAGSPTSDVVPSELPGPAARLSPSQLASDASVGEVTPPHHASTNTGYHGVYRTGSNSASTSAVSSLAGAVPVSIMHGKTTRQHTSLRKRDSTVQRMMADHPSQSSLDDGDAHHHHHEQPECSRCDSDDIFGRFVAHEMRQITDARLKRIVKFKVHAAIMEAYSPDTPV